MPSGVNPLIQQSTVRDSPNTVRAKRVESSVSASAGFSTSRLLSKFILGMVEGREETLDSGLAKQMPTGKNRFENGFDVSLLQLVMNPVPGTTEAGRAPHYPPPPDLSSVPMTAGRCNPCSLGDCLPPASQQLREVRKRTAGSAGPLLLRKQPISDPGVDQWEARMNRPG